MPQIKEGLHGAKTLRSCVRRQKVTGWCGRLRAPEEGAVPLACSGFVGFCGVAVALCGGLMPISSGAFAEAVEEVGGVVFEGGGVAVALR